MMYFLQTHLARWRQSTHPQLDRYRSLLRLLRREPKGHQSFSTFVLAFRFVALGGMTLRFILNRDEYTHAPELWNIIRLGLVAFLAYSVSLAMLRRFAPQRFHSRGLYLIQIGADLAMVSLMYFLTKDPQSDFFILYSFPLLMAAEYFGLVFNIGALGLASAILFGVLAAIQQSFGPVGQEIVLIVWLPRVFFLGTVNWAYLFHRRIQTPIETDLTKERAALLAQATQIADPRGAAEFRHRLELYTQQAERATNLQSWELQQKNDLINQQLLAIFSASQAVVTSDEDRAIATIMEAIGDVLGCQAGALRLLGQNENRKPSLVLRAAYGHYFHRYRQQAKYLDLDKPSIVVDAFRTHRQRYCRDVQAASAGATGDGVFFIDFARQYNLHSMICLPIHSSEVVQGTLTFYRETVRLFTPDEISLLNALASYLALMVANFGLYRESLTQTLERTEWLDTLYELSAQLTGLKELDSVLMFVAEKTRQRLKAETSAVFLLEGDTLKRKAIAGLDSDWFPEECYAIGQGLTGQVVCPSENGRSGKPVLENNVDESREVLPSHLSQYQQKLRSGQVKHLIAVPLNGQLGPFGVLRIVNKLDATDQLLLSGFVDRDLHLLYIIGCVVGIALENARLLEEAQRATHKAEQRAKNLAVLQQVSQTVSSSLGYTATLQATCRAAMELFGVDHYGLVLFEPNHHHGRVVAEYPDLGAVGLEIPVQDIPLEQELIHRREPMILSDVALAPGLGPIRDIFNRFDIRSILLAPVVGKNSVVLGSLSLDAIGHQRIFDPEEATLCAAFATQVAVAIENARLFEAAIDQKDRLREYVSVLGDKLVEHTNLAGLCNLIVHSGARLLSAEDCSLYLANEAGTILTLSAASHLPLNELAQMELPISAQPRVGLTAYVAATGERLKFVGDSFQHHPAWSGGFRDHLKYFASGACKSLLIMPIHTAQGKPVGVLKVENKYGREAEQGFSEFDEELLAVLANQTAINIRRVLQFQRVSQEAAQRERTRLQGDLHEAMNVFHSGVMLEAEVALIDLDRKQYDKAKAELYQMWRVSRFTYGELANILEDLRDPILQKEGLTAALRHYAELLGPGLISFYSKVNVPLDFDVAYALYRIAQGAISNAIRHAGLNQISDGQIWVDLDCDGKTVNLSVRDNGHGFDMKTAKLGYPVPFGLKRMQDLAKSLNTTLSIQSHPGQGTRIEITVTLKEVRHEVNDTSLIG